MPPTNVTVIEHVFTAELEHDIIERGTEAMLDTEGENMQRVT